jgi:hypothetical protein
MELHAHVANSWGSLDELQEWAFRRGFTQDQMGYAIDRVGSNPHDVAAELQRHLLMARQQYGHRAAVLRPLPPTS